MAHLLKVFTFSHDHIEMKQEQKTKSLSLLTGRSWQYEVKNVSMLLLFFLNKGSLIKLQKKIQYITVLDWIFNEWTLKTLKYVTKKYLAENSIIETINMSIMNKVYKYLCQSLAGWSVHSDISCDTDVGAGRRWASASCHFPIPFPSLSQLIMVRFFFQSNCNFVLRYYISRWD